MRQYTFRLKSGDDLKPNLLEFSKEKELTSAIIICSVGSLSHAKFRLPVVDGKPQYRNYSEHMEILTLNGRVNVDGSHAHLHITACLEDGTVVGGHLEEGCIVRTTAEIVLLTFEDTIYDIEFDQETGYNELSVKPTTIE